MIAAPQAAHAVSGARPTATVCLAQRDLIIR